jgi:ATP-dependent 26S proteasome regulatory subunit
MNPLPANAAAKPKLPPGITLEKPPFVPRLVMTDRLQTVVREVLHQWRNRQRFAGLRKYGIRPLDHLLFHGPPGNGKTMACYWIARELDIPIYRVLCNQLLGSYLGQTTNAVSDVLSYLNALPAPALCLWDEVESIFVDRARASGGGGQELSTATTMYLQALDRWQAPVLNVMATNLPNRVDPALRSRVELTLEFPGPNPEQCREMLNYWAELLDAHGGSAWGPKLAERVAANPPESFRALQQLIGFAAREWTAANGR